MAEVVRLRAENIDSFQPLRSPGITCMVSGCRKGAKITIFYSSGTAMENQRRGYVCPVHVCDFANAVLGKYKFNQTV